MSLGRGHRSSRSMRRYRGHEDYVTDAKIDSCHNSSTINSYEGKTPTSLGENIFFLVILPLVLVLCIYFLYSNIHIAVRP